MKYDFVNELGYLALASRLKRLSDAMIHSGRKLYKELGLEIEPNWYLIFKLLKKYRRLSIMEIAEKIHFSHPSVISMISKMEQLGYIKITDDLRDGRKRICQLTVKALDEFPGLERVWKSGEDGIRKLFAEQSKFLLELERLEIQLSESDFKDRTIQELQNKS